MDDSEDDVENPVVSFTLGLPAVFLLGTRERDAPPVPLLLRAGDAMMLGGGTRLCYHGVANVLPQPLPPKEGFPVSPEWGVPHLPGVESSPRPHGVDALTDDEVREQLKKYRINLNVRQVLRDGAVSLDPRSV